MSERPDVTVASLHAHRLRAVRRRMGTALLPTLPPERLGDVRLLPHQRQAAARLQRILDRHHGALLADAVGLGKTFTALAVASRYAHTVIVAPAGLLVMWQAALLRSGQSQVPVYSLHRASRNAPPPFAVTGTNTGTNTGTDTGVAPSARTLVIIDEAHALRNPRTTRYQRIAEAVTGCDVLLLTATPLHNSTRDLRALFALFRGAHTDALRTDTLMSLIVRRDRPPTTPSSGAPPRGGASTAGSLPAMRRHRALTMPQDPHTLEQLLALPAPLPARDGAVAGALVRLGLLRAWCSSDAALTHALDRRLQRGAAMRDALAAGRYPCADELRTWIIGDAPGADMQLGFPELLIDQPLASPERQRSLLEQLARHAEALQRLRDHHVAVSRADDLRAACLRQIRRRHGATPVVAFSQHARTIQALFRALSDIAGVGMLTSRYARIATGPIQRTTLLECFAPRAQGRPPPPPTMALSLLLTTDLIAEGVNLQDAGVIVHLDLPWTHALRTQRTGRVARLGSPYACVHEYRFRAAAPARRALRAEARVAHKARLSARFVGGDRVPAPADLRHAWLTRLEGWALADDVTPHDTVGASPRTAELTVVEPLTAALVLVRTAAGAQLLAIVAQPDGRLRVSDRVDVLLALSDGRMPPRWRRADAAHRPPAPRALPMPRVRRAIQRWIAHAQLRSSCGLSSAAERTGREVDEAPPLNRTQQRAQRWLRELVGTWSTVSRRQRRDDLREAHACILAARSAAGERALQAWMHACTQAGTQAAHNHRQEDSVRAWRHHAVLVQAMAASLSAPAASPTAAPAVRSTPVIDACLFIRPGQAPAPT